MRRTVWFPGVAWRPSDGSDAAEAPQPAASGITGLAAWGSVVTPVGQPHPRRTRRNRELDAYTALAVVASVVFTAYQFCNVGEGLYPGSPAHTLLSSLDAAVPWFFVLIGHRLFRPIVRAFLDQTPVTPTPTWLVRQAIAIIPAYYVVVFVVWFCRQQSLPGDWHDLLEHLTFTQVFDAKRIFYTDGPAWAVSVTVFFLLLLAWANTAISRFGGISTRREGLVVLTVPTAALASISFAWKAWSLAGAHRPTAVSSTTWYGPLANLDNFAMGMAVAVGLAALERTGPVLPRYRVALRAAAVVLVGAAAVTRHDDSWSAAYFTTICSLGFACLIASAMLAADAQADPHRSAPTLTWLGRIAVIAYGTYLWREPVLLTLNGWDGVVRQAPDAFIQDTAVVLVVSLLIGWLSYVAIEQPALQLYSIALKSRRHAPPALLLVASEPEHGTCPTTSAPSGTASADD